VSVEQRIQALEKLYGTKTPREEDPAEEARRRAQFAAKLERVEETEGNPRRRIALSELKETMKERIRRRTSGP
jgi:hypothetical protein